MRTKKFHWLTPHAADPWVPKPGFGIKYCRFGLREVVQTTRRARSIQLHRVSVQTEPRRPVSCPKSWSYETTFSVVLTIFDLVLTIDYLVLTIDYLVLTNDDLVLTNDYLVVTND